MKTEFHELSEEGQEVVSDALCRAIASMQDAGLLAEYADHDDLLQSMVDFYIDASSRKGPKS